MRQCARLAVTLLAATIAAASLAGRAAATTVTLHLGDTFSASGHTAAIAGEPTTGVVVVRGRWGGGPWRVVATTRTDATGRYRFRIKPSRRGVLTLRITPPDKQDKQFVLRVI